MSPVINQINTEAIKPLDAGQITQEEALEKGIEPLRQFMYKQTQVKDVKLFMDIAGEEWTDDLDAIPNSVLIPSFIISELRTAFIIGFIIVWIIPMMKEANEDAKYRSYNASIGRKTYWSSTGERYVSDNRKVGK